MVDIYHQIMVRDGELFTRVSTGLVLLVHLYLLHAVEQLSVQVGEMDTVIVLRLHILMVSIQDMLT